MLCCITGFTQVKINHNLVMTAADSMQRTITGLADPADTSDLLPVRTLLTNQLLFSETNDNDTLEANLPFSFNLTEGTMLWVFSNFNTDNNLKLTTNQSVFYPVINANGTSDTNCIKQNEIELLIYNGSSFQEMFYGFNICPQGYVEVNSSYCIQINENTSANYWNAILDCERDNAKLCSWGEWYYACQRTGLGLNNITNNWEWTESANNHATSVLVLGNGSCDTAGENNTQVTALRTYRCCYRKK